MKKLALITLSLLLLSGYVSKSLADTCTEEELQGKITALMMVIQDVCQKDPEKCQKVSTEMQTRLDGLRKDPSVDKLCRFYDDFLQGLQK